MKNYSIFSIAVFLFCSLFFCESNAQQNNDKSNFWEKVRFGGNLGADFGNFTSIIVAPQAIYQVNNYVGLGTGLNYSYSERDSNDFKSTMVGGSLIAMAQPIDFLQVSADFEYLNVNKNFDNSAFDRKYWIPALFLGAGYNQGGFVVGVRYDVLYDDNRSVYQNGIQPFVRVLF